MFHMVIVVSEECEMHKKQHLFSGQIQTFRFPKIT